MRGSSGPKLMPSHFETFTLGLIEGFYGEPWSWEARAGYALFLKTHGFRFYIYAPKADAHLRRRWCEDWPKEEADALLRLRHHYRDAGVLFGLGLTPYGLHDAFDEAGARALDEKIRRLNVFELDLLAVLFDDVPSVTPVLARTQCAIAHRAMQESNAQGFLFCPTYYSYDPLIERALGPRPERYLEEIGETLEAKVQVFWTGERICSTGYPEPHLAEVALKLKRKPYLWDNYPVNDGPRMSRHLHLRAFTGRRPHLNRTAAGLAANPMNQAALSKIPLATLSLALTRASHDPAAAFAEAARSLCGETLAAALTQDLALFHDQGLDAISPERKAELIAKYERFDHDCAREVVAWLKGDYEPDAQVVAEFSDYV